MISSFALALLLATDAPTTAAQAEQPAPEEPKMICRRIPELGSRVRSQRICRTKQQWADEREQNRQSITKAQINRGTSGD
jgi:hypothetical protein